MLLDPDLLAAFCGAVDTYAWVLEEAKHHDDDDVVVGLGLRRGWLLLLLLAQSQPTISLLSHFFCSCYFGRHSDIGVSEDSVGDGASRDELRATGPGRHVAALMLPQLFVDGRYSGSRRGGHAPPLP
ncbi:hypothetical protein OsI_38038 [Oryza sativa Indica Group]|uniref:Uncharacterized protein n=1 Tax=Oryza sativa subsp. indica TaxID=39946 RepID=B8BP72_ORYSI|nr:hypothetical protein OsI_38038 [Oryza sativa Indica Group]